MLFVFAMLLAVTVPDATADASGAGVATSSSTATPIPTPDAAPAPTSGAGESTTPPRAPRWNLNLAVATGTAVVLPGLAVGAEAAASRALGGGPFFAGVHVRLAAASAANASWTIDHRELVAAVGLGARARLGAGQLWADAGGGVLALEEVLGRHQLQRIEMAQVPGGTETSYVVGPHAFAEIGLAVRLRGAVSASLSAGPIASHISVDTDAAWRFGLSTRLGISYER